MKQFSLPEDRKQARCCLAVLLISIGLLFSTQALANFEQPDLSPTARTFWSEGFRFKSENEYLELRLKARIEGETAIFGSNDILESQVGELNNDSQIRRARVAFQGSVGHQFYFKMETGFSDSELAIKTVYAGLRNMPHDPTVRVGHLKEPVSFEWATSSRDAMFLERSVMSALRPSRNTGVLVNHASKMGRSTVAAGLFRSIRGQEDRGIGKNPTRAVTVRATALPWMDENSAVQVVHLGLSYSHRNYLDGKIRFKAEPEMDLAPNFADSGTLNAKSSTLLGLEFALLVGPWSLQAETIYAEVDSDEDKDPLFKAAYLAVSWFPTGENRPYNYRTGRFGRVHPTRNFLSTKTDWGAGAWEIALRYSRLDLDDGPVKGGRLRGMTFGVNWYLNPQIKILANVVQSELRGSDSVRMAGLRIQMDF